YAQCEEGRADREADARITTRVSRVESKRFAFEQARQFADGATGVAHEQSLQRRNGVDNIEAEAAGQRERREAVGKQTIENIGRSSEQHVVEAAPRLIARQHRRRTDIEAQALRFDQYLRQSRDIAQTEVQALTGNGMNAV